MDKWDLGSERKREMDGTAGTRKCQAHSERLGVPCLSRARSLRHWLLELLSLSLNWEKCSLLLGECHLRISHLPHCTEMTHYLKEQFKAEKKTEGSSCLLMYWKAWLCVSVMPAVQNNLLLPQVKVLPFSQGRSLAQPTCVIMQLVCRFLQAKSMPMWFPAPFTSMPPVKGCVPRKFKN